MFEAIITLLVQNAILIGSLAVVALLATGITAIFDKRTIDRYNEEHPS